MSSALVGHGYDSRVICVEANLTWHKGEGMLKISYCWAEYSHLKVADFILVLTPRSRVLENLTSFQLVKKSPVFYGTQRFITALTVAHHLFLSWVSFIHSIPPHPTSWRSILILSHLCLGIPSGLSHRFLHNSPLLSPIQSTCTAHVILLDLITRTILGEEYISLSSSLCSLLHSPVTTSLLDPSILLSTLFSNTLSLCSSFSVSGQV